MVFEVRRWTLNSERLNNWIKNGEMSSQQAPDPVSSARSKFLKKNYSLLLSVGGLTSPTARSPKNFLISSLTTLFIHPPSTVLHPSYSGCKKIRILLFVDVMGESSAEPFYILTCCYHCESAVLCVSAAAVRWWGALLKLLFPLNKHCFANVFGSHI